MARLADLIAAGISTVPRVGATVTGKDVLMRKRAEDLGIKKLRYIN